MSRDLEKRLQQLEAEAARRQAAEWKREYQPIVVLVRYCIGYYLTELQAGEAPAAAYARALGYSGHYEFKQAVERNLKDVQDRHAQAARRLFAKFGVDLDAKGGDDAHLDALDRMEAGLPEALKMRLQREIDSKGGADVGSRL